MTLDRPKARNACASPWPMPCGTRSTAAGDDREVDAVIITGSDPAFCAGVDLKEVSGEVPGSRRPDGDQAKAPNGTATGSGGSCP